jgi:hypothetical protein
MPLTDHISKTSAKEVRGSGCWIGSLGSLRMQNKDFGYLVKSWLRPVPHVTSDFWVEQGDLPLL